MIVDNDAVSGRPLTGQPAGGPADLSPSGSQPDGAHQAQGDWIEWHGGKCPLTPGQRFYVRYEDGLESEGCIMAHPHWLEDAAWGRAPDGNNIVAYKLEEAQP